VQVRVPSEVSVNRGTGGDNARSVSGGRGTTGRLRGGAIRVSERAVVGLNVGQFILGACVMLKGSASLEGFRTATVFGCRVGLRTNAFGKPAFHSAIVGWQDSFGMSFGVRRFILGMWRLRVSRLKGYDVNMRLRCRTK